MKNKIILISLIAIMLISGLVILTGCGNDNNSNNVEEKIDLSMVGIYKMVEMERNGFSLDEVGLSKFGYSGSLEVKNDKTATITINSDTTTLTFDENSFTNPQNEKFNYTYENDKIKMESDGTIMTFRKDN